MTFCVANISRYKTVSLVAKMSDAIMAVPQATIATYFVSIGPYVDAIRADKGGTSSGHFCHSLRIWAIGWFSRTQRDTVTVKFESRYMVLAEVLNVLRILPQLKVFMILPIDYGIGAHKGY